MWNFFGINSSKAKFIRKNGIILQFKKISSEQKIGLCMSQQEATLKAKL